MSHQKPEGQRNWILGPALIVGLAAVAATVHGLTVVALGAGVPEQLAWLYPVITDGLALVAYAATHVLTGKGRGYAWAVVIVSAGLSGLGQAAFLAGGVAVTPTWLRFGVGYWPAIAGAAAAHLLYLIAVAHRRRLAELAEQRRLEEEARARAEAKRIEAEERAEQRRAARATASTGRGSRAGTRRPKTPAKTGTGSTAKPVPATAAAASTDVGIDTSTPARTTAPDAAARLHVVPSTDRPDAGQWDPELWRRAVSTAREYWREHRADARIDDFQALGIGRNKAAELRRAVLASGEHLTDPGTDASTGTDRATQ